jgi:hypothetical protein
MANKDYRGVIGSLMYLSICTRPDITFAVNRLSSYLSNPGPKMWAAAMRVLRYIQETKDMGLVYLNDGGDCQLLSYSDANHAPEWSKRKSTGGYLNFMGSSLISWKSQLQKTVALSTTDAEYIAANEAAREIAWLKNLFEELEIGFKQSRLLSDNNACISISKDPCLHTRTKHLDTRYYYIKEKVEEGSLLVEYCATENMVADIMTKPLPRVAFQSFRDSLSLGMKESSQ